MLIFSLKNTLNSAVREVLLKIVVLVTIAALERVFLLFYDIAAERPVIHLTTELDL